MTDASQQKIPITFSIIVKPNPLYIKVNGEQYCHVVMPVVCRLP